MNRVHVDSFARHLARLLEKGSLPARSLAARDRSRLQSLLDAGVLAEERQGAGRSVVLHDETALQAFIHSLYPHGLTGGLAGHLPPRSRAVAFRRDAKMAVRGGAEAVLLRGFGNAFLSSEAGTLPVAEWTRQAGAAALLLDDKTPAWGCDGMLAIVENQEVFVHFETLGSAADLALYVGGRLSGRVIDWLASSPMSACRIVHWGDYDPVGLDEYLRLSRACPGRTRLHLPEDIDQLFARYGKRELIEKGQTILRRLRKSADPAVRLVVGLMDRYGAGLEQEALLIGREERSIVP